MMDLWLIILLVLDTLPLDLLLSWLLINSALEVVCNQLFVVAEGSSLILNIWLTILKFFLAFEGAYSY